MTNIRSYLKINNFRIAVSLGITKEEQSSPQDIEITIEISNKILPHGCISDNITDTICYDKLCSSVLNYSQSKSFNLIEHLTYGLYLLIKEKISDPIKISVKKCNPPVNNLFGGAIFTIED